MLKDQAMIVLSAEVFLHTVDLSHVRTEEEQSLPGNRKLNQMKVTVRMNLARRKRAGVLIGNRSEFVNVGFLR